MIIVENCSNMASFVSDHLENDCCELSNEDVDNKSSCDEGDYFDAETDTNEIDVIFFSP